MSKFFQAYHMSSWLWNVRTSMHGIHTFRNLSPAIRTSNSICEYHTLLSRLQRLRYGKQFPACQQAQTISQVDVETHHHKLPGLFWLSDPDHKHPSSQQYYPGLSELTDVGEGITAHNDVNHILEPFIQEPAVCESTLTHGGTVHHDKQMLHLQSTDNTPDAKDTSTLDTKELTEKEKIILKLLSTALPEDGDRSKDVLHHLLEVINYLEHHGCQSYQVVEYPAICNLSLQEIDERIERLQALDLPISIPLLGMASMKNNNKLLKQATTYMDLNEGHSSVGDFWKERLHASEGEMLNLVEICDRRLITKPRKSDVKRHKLDYLLSQGYSPHEIRDIPLVLLNVSLDKLQQRVCDYAAMELGKPPLQVLAMSQAKYQRQLKKTGGETTQWDVQEVVENMAELLGESEESVINIRKYLLTDWPVLKEKLVFLLDKGVESSSILFCPKILRLSHSQLEQAYRDLESLHFEELSLDMIYNYVTHGNVHEQKKGNVALANLLQLNKGDMKLLRSDVHKRAFLQSSHVISQNIKFLKDQGFTIGDIRQLPVIVCHDTDVLAHHWSMLPDQDDMNPCEQIVDKPVALLNCLQYSIEKEQNFKYSVILSNGKLTD